MRTFALIILFHFIDYRNNMKSFFSSLLILSLLASCGEKGKDNLMPELNAADSAAVVFYTTPGNPRFYTFAKITDTVQLRSFAIRANKSAKTMKDDCLTEGKIFFYKGKEEAYPVYFSTSAGCRKMYFIRTGVKYYTPLPSDLENYLLELKKTAREPAGEDNR